MTFWDWIAVLGCVIGGVAVQGVLLAINIRKMREARLAKRENKDLLEQVSKGRNEAMRAFNKLQIVVHMMGGHIDFHEATDGATFQVKMPPGFPPLSHDELQPTIH